MPFVRRNMHGQIDAIFDHPEPGAEEELLSDHPDVMAFLTSIDSQSAAQAAQWAKEDLALARVAEDLIDVLIEKGVIAFTDLPLPAQQKLIKRRGKRQEMDYVSTLFSMVDPDDGGSFF